MYFFCLICVTSDSGMKVKEKSSSTSKRTVTKTTTVKVRAEKKVYSLPGQKYDPPEEVARVAHLLPYFYLF